MALLLILFATCYLMGCAVFQTRGALPVAFASAITVSVWLLGP